jgi:hypothetical protein
MHIVTLLPKGTELICIKEHPDGSFTIGESYKVNAHRVKGAYIGIRIRDDKRERKDFNFIPESKNFIWKYFRLTI